VVTEERSVEECIQLSAYLVVTLIRIGIISIGTSVTDDDCDDKVKGMFITLLCSARELELEDRQSRLEAQLRERIASEGNELQCWNLIVMLSVIPKNGIYFLIFASSK